MLVLSRKINESLVLVDHATITVCGFAANKVSLGIEANRDIKVVRKEHLEKERKIDSVIEWNYIGDGCWVGSRDGLPLWDVRITAQGQFDTALSVPSRAYKLNKPIFHSLESARRAIDIAESHFSDAFANC